MDSIYLSFNICLCWENYSALSNPPRLRSWRIGKLRLFESREPLRRLDSEQPDSIRFLPGMVGRIS